MIEIVSQLMASETGAMHDGARDGQHELEGNVDSTVLGAIHLVVRLAHACCDDRSTSGEHFCETYATN